MKFSRFSYFTAVLLVPASLATTSLAQSAVGSTASTTQAQRANDFVQAIGVNTHLGYWDTAWGVGNGTWAGDEAKVQAELTYLGMTHVRDGAPNAADEPEFGELAAVGIRFDCIQDIDGKGVVNVANDVTNMHALEAAHPGAVEFYEGANEFNTNNYTLAGRLSQGDLSWGAADDLAGKQALQSDALLSSAGIKIVAASTASIDTASVLPTGLVDYTNWHTYSSNGQYLQLQDHMLMDITAARATDPSKPVLITEAGSASTPASANATFAAAGDAATQAILDVNAVLDGYKDGAARTYLYVLMDQAAPDAQLENNFGLFRADGSPKAAATSFHNLIRILADPGAGSFQTGSMAMNINGLPSTASSMLLQKSFGTFDAVVWNGNAPVQDKNDGALSPPNNAISVNLGATYAKVEVYDPIQSDAPIQTLTNVSTVALNLSFDPLIVQVEPNASGSSDPSSGTVSSAAWYTITNQKSKSCMDASGWGTSNGTAVQQWTCVGQQWNQQWQFQPSDSGYYSLVSRNAPGEVVDVNNGGTSNRSIVQLWQAWGGGNQQWMPVALGNGIYKFVGRSSGRCLDIPGASMANGVQMQLYDCNGTSAQSFQLTSQP